MPDRLFKVSVKAEAGSLGVSFNRLWSAAMFSKFADGLAGAAIPLLAASLTRDPVLIAIQSNMMLLPWLFLAIPLGAILDRVNRRLAMLLVQISRVLIGATIAALILSGGLSLWMLMLLTFCFGVSEVVYDTATQSSIPTLLKGNQLERGNSKLQIADTVMQSFIGVPLGGVLYVVFTASPFMGLALCYVVAAVLIFSLARDALQGKFTAKSDRPKLSVEIKVALDYLIGHKPLLRLVIVTGAVALFYAMGQATLVLFILDHLKVPEAGYGWVMLPLAVGALVGAFASPKLSNRFGRSQALAISLPASSFALLIAGLAPNVTWFVLASLVHGFFIAQWNILLMSTYHLMIPNEIFGRIHGIRRTFVWGLMPVGGLVGGLIGKIDITLPMVVGGICAVVVAASQIKFVSSIRT
jgi:MFS family permease